MALKKYFCKVRLHTAIYHESTTLANFRFVFVIVEKYIDMRYTLYEMKTSNDYQYLINSIINRQEIDESRCVDKV